MRANARRISFRRVALAGGDDEAGQPPERRIAGALAQLDLARIERLAVAGDQRLHHRMLGLMRLQIADAAARLAAGAADHLMQKLEGALAGARIAVAEAEIGIDDADQIEPRKMMTLGDELRADDQSNRPSRHVVEFGAQALDQFDQIAREHQDARVRETASAASCSSRSTPGPTGDEAFGGVAVRAFLRRRHGEAAMMADQPLTEAMIDQPGVAVRALQAKAAGAAQCQRRVAAAVEEQQRLFAAFQRDLHRFGQPRRDEAAARRPFGAQVDGFDLRQMRAAETLRQMQMRDSARAAH